MDKRAADENYSTATDPRQTFIPSENNIFITLANTALVSIFEAEETICSGLSVGVAVCRLINRSLNWADFYPTKNRFNVMPVTDLDATRIHLVYGEEFLACHEIDKAAAFINGRICREYVYYLLMILIAKSNVKQIKNFNTSL